MNLYAYCYGNPLNLYDPDGLKPGDPFKTMDDAAIDALNFIKPSGYDTPAREQAGLIYKANGNYYATCPAKGKQRNGLENGESDGYATKDQIPKGGVIYGTYHNHYQGLSPDFSPADKKLGVSLQKYMWMTGTPPYDGGNKRFTPPKIGDPFDSTLPDSADPNVTKLGDSPSKCK